MASQRQKIQQKNRRCIAFGQEPFIAAIRVPTKEERTSAHGPRQVSRLEATGQKGINTLEITRTLFLETGQEPFMTIVTAQ